MTNREKELFCKMFQLSPMDVIFIDDKEDPLYAFWKMVKAEKLPGHCLIVVPEKPIGYSTQDVKEFDVIQIGMGFIFNYNTATGVQVRPSQRGLFFRR